MTGPYDEDEIRPEEPVVVRDRRKVDPETSELRQESTLRERPVGGTDTQPDTAAGSPDGAEVVEPADVDTGEPAEAVSPVEKELAERTADLQRVQAEYANYRKRVDRDREAERTAAKAAVVSEMLPLLDDLGRAEAHGDLTGAFKAVADKLTDVLTRSGLTAFGAEGEEFDPNVHEAVQHDTSPEVSGPTVTTVLRQGYALGEKVLRHAMVAVTDHEPEPGPTQDAADEQAAAQGGPIDPPAEGQLPVDGDENTQ